LKKSVGVSRFIGDKDRFVEVDSNLLDNAIKFTVWWKIALKSMDEGEVRHITVLITYRHSEEII